MKALHEVEHKFLSMFILDGEEKFPNAKYEILASNFSSLCMTVLESVCERECVNDINFCSPEDFIAVRLPAITVGNTTYNLLKFYFPFYEMPDFSALCHHAYLVSRNIRGKIVYSYFTVEYDAMTGGEYGQGSYWLGGWKFSPNGGYSHLNMGQIKLDDEVEISRILSSLSGESAPNASTHVSGKSQGSSNTKASSGAGCLIPVLIILTLFMILR